MMCTDVVHMRSTNDFMVDLNTVRAESAQHTLCEGVDIQPESDNENQQDPTIHGEAQSRGGELWKVVNKLRVKTLQV